jgi:hypothetical protein
MSSRKKIKTDKKLLENRVFQVSVERLPADGFQAISDTLRT